MRDLKRFFEVLFLEVLLEHTGVEVVVHLIVKPRECAGFNGLQTLGRDRLTVRRFLDGFLTRNICVGHHNHPRRTSAVVLGW